MSAIHSTGQPVSVGDGNAAPPVPSVEIDASCRVPVLLLFVSSAAWLLLGSILHMVATLKFHSPAFLADCPWLTYGRVHPASLNAFVYGFAAQAGLGVMLWLMAHLGRTRLAFSPGIVVGAVFWNIGATLGVLGILYGESTGFEWLEMPRYASVMLFGSYLVIGFGGALTFHARREKQLYISQWFLLAALFWFPWIYSTANLLLVAKPVRGALQAVIDYWYTNNLTTIWFGFIGLAGLFYFIPRIIKRPLHSHYLGVFAFWILALFGSWGVIPAGTPLPSWIPALSTVAAMLTIVPILAVAINIRRTFAGDFSALRGNIPLKFVLFGATAYVIAGLAGAVASIDRVSEITNFTWFVPAQTQLMLYGFFTMTMFGAVYYIVPRLTGTEFASPRLVLGHFRLSALGILLYVIPLAIGGILQGFALNDKNVLFPSVMASTFPFLRASTVGDACMVWGNLAFLFNLAVLLVRLARVSVSTAWAGSVKTAEVVS